MKIANRLKNILLIFVCVCICIVAIQFILLKVAPPYRVLCARVYYQIRYGEHTEDVGQNRRKEYLRLDDGNLITYKENWIGIVTSDNYKTYASGKELAKEVQTVADNYFEDCHVVYSPFADYANNKEDYCTILLQIPEQGPNSDEDTVKACLQECGGLNADIQYEVSCTLLPQNIYDGTKDITIYPADGFVEYGNYSNSDIYMSMIEEFGTADFISLRLNGFICGYVESEDGEPHTMFEEYD